MRVLFTTWAWKSHLHALVPLAWAFRAAGHDVLVASQSGFAGEVSRTGLPWVDVGCAVDAVGMVRGYLLPTGNDPAPVAAPRRGPRALDMFLAHAESMVDGLVDTARQWRPDLVVFEPTALAGPVAAAAIGVPAVRHLYGTDLMARARSLLPDLLAPLAKRHGVGEFDPFGAVDVDPVPGRLQVPSDRPRLPMRYVPYNGPSPLPVAPSRSDGPRICVTWGHTIFRLDPARFLLPRVVEALAGFDVVAAVSSDQAERLGDVPTGVRVVVDTALDHLLPDCDLVMAHGGAGTMLTAAAHGVPQVLVPQLPDHAGHAARVLAAGVGEVLTPDEATTGRLRAEAARLIHDHTVREAADELRRTVHDLPTPAEVVAELAVVPARVAS